MTFYLGAVAAVFALAKLQAAPMTLDDALKIADQNSFGLKLADSAVEKARQKAAESVGALGPKVNLEGTYTRFDKAIINDFGGTPTVSRPIDTKEGRLTLTMPVDIFGKTGRAVRSGARLNVQIAEANRKAVANDLHQAVKKAFFGVLQAQASLGVAVESRDLAAQRLKNAKAELEAGTRARVDVIRLETALAQADNDVIAATGALALAKNVLNNTLGRRIETPFTVAEAPLWKPTQKTEEELTQLATESRPELEAAQKQYLLAVSVRQVEERGGAPSLNLSANHNRSFGQTGFGASSSSTVGVLSVSMPIWDSGITRARVKAARQDEEAAKLQLAQSTLAISLEVRQALVNLRNADTRVQVAEQQVKLAEETYRLTSIKFEAGEGIPLEIADAATQLSLARSQLVNAKYDYLRSIADLERAIGRDLMPEGSR